MRLGVLDVGSNTVHLLVVDAHPGARPLPASSHKVELRLSEHVTSTGAIDSAGIDDLSAFVGQCLHEAEEAGVEQLLPFATSAIREAPNGEEVLTAVHNETGVRLHVLTGEEEARLTFLAARRWCGWSAGTLSVIDIGGGSLELATGMDEDPDVAISMPLGAGRVTRDHLPGNPPTAEAIHDARKAVRARIATDIRALAKAPRADLTVGTSKTVRSLARIAGAEASSAGPYVTRRLRRDDLSAVVTQLAPMNFDERAALPGVSAPRAPQLLAGAIVIEAAMDLLGIEELEVCPWALREGIILRELDAMRA